MSLKIRLARAGSKKRPYFHIIVADSRSPRDGRFIERLGFWNPILNDDNNRFDFDKDRIKYWLTQGAQPTNRIMIFLNNNNIKKYKIKNNPIKGKPRKKT